MSEGENCLLSPVSLSLQICTLDDDELIIPMQDYQINYEVISDDGSVMERGKAYTDSQTLSPGQTASFQNLIPDGAKSLRAISVESDE